MTTRLLAALALACVLTLALGDAGHAEQSQSLEQEAEQYAASAFEDALQRARKLLSQYGYAAVFGALFLEGIGIPAPGEMLMLAAAADAGQGSLNIVVLLMLTVVAAVAGNSAGFAIGRFGGRRVLHKLPISDERLARVETLFERYGGWFILIARFIDGPRQLNGMIAGTLEMPWWRFTFWNVLGAMLWVFVWGGGAYWFGRDFTKIMPTLQRFEPFAIGLAVAALLVGVIYIWRRRGSRHASS
ncbi:MAG: DedA family protein [Pseudomonadota bacterium]